MSKKVLFPLTAVVALGFAASTLGCHAEARIGNAEPKAATPPPPPAPPPPPPPPPAPAVEAAPPKPIKVVGRAKVEGNTIKIPGKVHFDTDKATLKDDKETKEILQTVADLMKENAHITKLRVEGHTDDQGAADHNQTLSQQRAESVLEALVKAGVDKGRIDPKGWGQDRPLVKNDSANNREQNRRVEFKIWELEGKATDAQKNDGAPSTATASTATTSAAAATDPKKAATAGTTPPAAGTAKAGTATATTPAAAGTAPKK
jgi:outer membrane protein OmpA-like peptidoglycan-associated protein